MQVDTNDVKAAMSVVKSIVSQADEGYRQYVFKDGNLIVRSRSMVGCIPLLFEPEEPLVVPIEPFDKSMQIAKNSCEVDIGPARVSMKSGKSVLWIPNLKYDTALYQYDSMPDDDEIEFDDNLRDAIRTVLPFIETKQVSDWNNAVVVEDGKLIGVFRNRVMVSTPFPDLEGRSLLLPPALASVIVNAPSPVISMRLDANKVQVNFEDDSWVQSAQVSGKPPAKLMKMLNPKPDEAFAEIADEQRDVLRDAITFGTGEVVVTHTGVKAASESGEFSAEVNFDIGEAKQLVFAARELSMVLNVATHWSFAEWPAPTAFKGDAIHGLVSTRS